MMYLKCLYDILHKIMHNEGMESIVKVFACLYMTYKHRLSYPHGAYIFIIYLHTVYYCREQRPISLNETYHYVNDKLYEVDNQLCKYS